MKAAEVVRLLGDQRHDFLNHLQVLSGFLDLGHPEKASAYLKEILEQINQERELFKNYEPDAALPLYIFKTQAREMGVAVAYREVKLSPQGYHEGLIQECLTILRDFLAVKGAERPDSEVEVSLVVEGDLVVCKAGFQGERPQEFIVTGGGSGVR